MGPTCSWHENVPTRWIALSLAPKRSDDGESAGTGKALANLMLPCSVCILHISRQKFEAATSMRLSARLPDNLRPNVRPLRQ